jgi:hypothetical protein
MSAGTIHIAPRRKAPTTDLATLRHLVPEVGGLDPTPDQVAAVFALCSRMPGDNGEVLAALGLIPTQSHKKEN